MGRLLRQLCLVAGFSLTYVFWGQSTAQSAEKSPAPPPSAERLPLQRFEYDFVAMGMKYHIAVYAPDAHVVVLALEKAEARVRELDLIMSDYNTESELSKLCDEAVPGEPVRISPEFYEILERSLALSEQTDGAFDVTVGPAIQLWRTARRAKKLPPPGLLQQSLKHVGWQGITLDPMSRTAEFHRPGIQLDLGGIAAGYACDEILAILRQYQLPRALIDCSGDVLVGDPPPGREGWSVSIAGLRGSTSDPGSRTVMLSNAAITTSGDARQFVEIDGVRYSHIVDPRTGLGLTRRSSTTVIAPTGWQADSYATAISVMGLNTGLDWIEKQPDCAALVFEVQGQTELIRQSSRFPASRPVGPPPAP